MSLWYTLSSHYRDISDVSIQRVYSAIARTQKTLFVLVPRSTVCLPSMACSVLQPTAPHGSFPAVVKANLKLAGRSLKARFASGSLSELEHMRGAYRERAVEYVSKVAFMPSALPDYRNQLMLMNCAGV